MHADSKLFLSPLDLVGPHRTTRSVWCVTLCSVYTVISTFVFLSANSYLACSEDDRKLPTSSAGAYDFLLLSAIKQPITSLLIIFTNLKNISVYCMYVPKSHCNKFSLHKSRFHL